MSIPRLFLTPYGRRPGDRKQVLSGLSQFLPIPLANAPSPLLGGGGCPVLFLSLPSMAKAE